MDHAATQAAIDGLKTHLTEVLGKQVERDDQIKQAIVDVGVKTDAAVVTTEKSLKLAERLEKRMDELEAKGQGAPPVDDNVDPEPVTTLTPDQRSAFHAMSRGGQMAPPEYGAVPAVENLPVLAAVARPDADLLAHRSTSPHSCPSVQACGWPEQSGRSWKVSRHS